MNFFQRLVIKTITKFYPVKVVGKENIIVDGSLVICNHLSAIDVVYLSKCYLKSDVNFVAKKELFNNAFMSKALSFFGAIPVDRDKPSVSSILKIIKSLKNGKTMVIFPEGTRNRSGTTELQNLKGGSGLFALKAKCKITPIFIYKKAKLFQKNYICIGKPFELSDFYDREITEENIVEMELSLSNRLNLVQRELYSYISKKKLKKREV